MIYNLFLVFVSTLIVSMIMSNFLPKFYYSEKLLTRVLVNFCFCVPPFIFIYDYDFLRLIATTILLVLIDRVCFLIAKKYVQLNNK